MPDEKQKRLFGDGDYIGAVFSKRQQLYALVIILLFSGIAVCRYLVIQPERMILEQDDPIGLYNGNPNDSASVHSADLGKTSRASSEIQ